jgi:hypothetical protein
VNPRYQYPIYVDADGDTTGVIETDTTDSSDTTNYAYTYSNDGNVLTSRMAPGDLTQSTTPSECDQDNRWIGDQGNRWGGVA